MEGGRGKAGSVFISECRVSTVTITPYTLCSYLEISNERIFWILAVVRRVFQSINGKLTCLGDLHVFQIMRLTRTVQYCFINIIRMILSVNPCKTNNQRII